MRIGGGITSGALGIFGETLLPFCSLSRVAEDNRCLRDCLRKGGASGGLPFGTFTLIGMLYGIDLRASVAHTQDEMTVFGEFARKGVEG